MKQRILPFLVLAALAGAASAKLPPPDEATKARAAETAARQAWQAKLDAFQLCKAQDRVAAKYNKGGKVEAKATQVPANAPAAPAAAAPAAGTAAAAAAPAAGAPPGPAPCVDPGPFAYNPPEQKPLETSGAHSPTGTAASPPSVKPDAAQMAPGKAGVPAAPATGAAPAGAAAPAKKS